MRALEAPMLNDVPTEVKFEAPASEPARPREPVKTGTLSTGSAAPATINKSLEQIQTGGFGDPNGVPGDSNPNKRSNIAGLGSPVLPPAPGYGSGTGGVSGVRRAVTSAGFGDGAAISPSSGGERTRGVIKPGGFETPVAGSDAPKPKRPDATPPVQPVVILSKPRPAYSDEARRLGLEGDVLIEVIFPASGPVQVVRVTSGLGHGLDEAAVRAAQQIRFKPALQDGKPVDFPATLHIEFQLAF
jgi:TonB family protein